MQIFDSQSHLRLAEQIATAGEALLDCIQDVVRKEINSAIQNLDHSQFKKEDEKLLTKKEMAEELDVSLVTLTDWMKRGLPFLRLNKRVYPRREEVLKAMSQSPGRLK